MPSNASGWFLHSLARETGRIGHLYSPGCHRGPWPWFPFALDNGAFACWDPKDNSFNEDRWRETEPQWKHLLAWSQKTEFKPMWAVVPDRPGHAVETFRRWAEYSPDVFLAGIPLALAVQDGMTAPMVRHLYPQPEVIAIGGTTDFKWSTVEMWVKEFPRVHVLRCNSPAKLHYLEKLGVESTDGTGWNRGDRTQTKGLEEWARGWHHTMHPLWPYVCRESKKVSIKNPKTCNQ